MREQHTPNFDVRPPVRIQDYLQAVHRLNVGYELTFELVTALLRAHCSDDAHLLLVDAGGGTEVRVFGRASPHWRFTGVDPSENMLALARATVDANNLTDRVELIRGTPDDLPPTLHYDAATCIYVLMHLPDDGRKLQLLKSIVQRLNPGAPLILVDAVRDHRATFEAAWQQYAEARGMPTAEMIAFLERIKTGSNTVTEARTLELLDEAGLHTATRFFTAFGMHGWIATP
jgi:tRNA (cmo5U34)-methyltransferase